MHSRLEKSVVTRPPPLLAFAAFSLLAFTDGWMRLTSPYASLIGCSTAVATCLAASLSDQLFILTAMVSRYLAGDDGVRAGLLWAPVPRETTMPALDGVFVPVHGTNVFFFFLVC